jgi:hypothetical protein
MNLKEGMKKEKRLCLEKKIYPEVSPRMVFNYLI